MSFEWRPNKSMRIDIAYAEVLATDPSGEVVVVEVGVPVIVHKDEGIIWASSEALPLGPVGLKVARMHFLKLQKVAVAWWPDMTKLTDWSLLFDA